MKRFGLAVSRRACVIRSATAVALVAGLAVVAPLVASAPASAQVPVSHFVLTVGGTDTSGDSAFLSTDATNGEPGDLLFVTPSPYHGETCPCLAVAPLPVIGVRYDRANREWAVFNENKAAMSADETFSVLAEPAASASVFTVHATGGSRSGDHVFISSPVTNDKPHAVLQVTQVLNPGGASGGVYNPRLVGVRYYKPQRKWAIVNENGARIPRGAAFNVLIGGSATGGGSPRVITTTTTSRVGDGTLFSNPVSNGNPNALVLDTPDWNPGGKGGTTSTSQTAVDYDTTSAHWGVFDQNGTSAPLHSAYNVLIFRAPQAPVQHFAWTATSTYTTGDSSLIDYRPTNGQPADLLFVTPDPYRGRTCPCLAVPSVPAIGVWYDAFTGEWAVFNENESTMPAGETYEVLAEPAAGAAVFTLHATHADTSGDHVFISSRLSNDKPRAVLTVTQVWNPGDGSLEGVYNPHPVGVRYYKAQRKWAVMNEDGKKMPAGASFNVLIGSSASGGGSTRVTTATAASRTGVATLFNDPAIDSAPGAFVFVTPDWNPGGKGGTTSTSQIAVGYDSTLRRWAVVDENGSPPPLKSAYNLLIFSS
jgi:hypothetical protein